MVGQMALFEVSGLSAGYDKEYVIADIAFSLRRGDFLTVMGCNGSGKSTLIKSLQGMLAKVSGTVLMEKSNLFELNSRQIAKSIAYVPQMSDLSFDFSVKEIIEMGRYSYQRRIGGVTSKDSRIVNEVMEKTDTDHLQNKNLGQLSGGERQRVFLARALAQDTPLLFLDEPSSHLDIKYQIEIYEILKRLQNESDKTVLAAEHNINLAIPYTQRILFLKKGRVHSLGPAEKLVTEETIREVFEVDVDIRKNPRTNLPEISLIPPSDR